MLKKMRIRVIIAAMLAFTLAVVLVATLVNVTNYFAYSRQADRIIDYVYLYHTKYDDRMQVFFVPAVEPFSGDLDEAERYMASFCLVNVNEDGAVMSSYMDHITSLSIETAYSYAQKIAKGNSDRGYYKEYRYAKKDIIGGNVIIFLDCSRDVASMRNVINMSIIISLGSLLLVFIMVVLLSRKAISPMAKNIELQKRFITDASHELKTPLTSISTSLDVIESEHGKSEWIDNIRQQVGRMSGMVSEMVTLSRLDEIKPVNEKEKFDLSTTSWEILEVHMPQAKARGIDIQTDIEDNIIIDGEKASIQELLSVLIDNAIKYSDERKEIRFTLKKERSKARIEVFNTCNYDKALDTERLFDRFYRPDESRNSKTGGNGIGLAIAKSVVETHGGKITAECPSGKSMTITVEL